MRRFATFAVLSLLAACGSEQSGTVATAEGEADYAVARQGETSTVTISSPNGEQIIANSGSGTDLPAGFGIFPGANVVSNTTVSQNGQGGAMVVMQSDASADAMIDFYRGQAEAAGIAIAMEINSGGAKMIGGEGPDGLAFSFTATPQDGGANGMLTIGQPTQ